jgi:hypothetical protein
MPPEELNISKLFQNFLSAVEWSDIYGEGDDVAYFLSFTSLKHRFAGSKFCVSLFCGKLQQ